MALYATVINFVEDNLHSKESVSKTFGMSLPCKVRIEGFKHSTYAIFEREKGEQIATFVFETLIYETKQK